MFSNEWLYQEFRAKFAIWLPNLKTLDGTDFKDDAALIQKMKNAEQEKKVKKEANPEKGGSKPSAFEKGIDKSVKAQSGNTAF